jgi:hypothetical protein
LAGCQCLLGASKWDAVAHGRARDVDQQMGAFQTICDDSYQLYAEAVAEDFSSWSPIGHFVIRSPGTNPVTSPINTVAFEQRCVLTGGALGDGQVDEAPPAMAVGSPGSCPSCCSGCNSAPRPISTCRVVLSSHRRREGVDR